jgi:hypothetical protein
VRGCGLDSSGSGYRPVAGSCENCNKIYVSIKDEQQVLKDSAPWNKSAELPLVHSDFQCLMNVMTRYAASELISDVAHAMLIQMLIHTDKCFKTLPN